MPVHFTATRQNVISWHGNRFSHMYIKNLNKCRYRFNKRNSAQTEIILYYLEIVADDCFVHSSRYQIHVTDSKSSSQKHSFRRQPSQLTGLVVTNMLV